MNFTLALTPSEQSLLAWKQGQQSKDDKTVPLDVLNARMLAAGQEYLDAIQRDMSAGDLAKVQAALTDPVKLAAAKLAVGL